MVQFCFPPQRLIDHLRVHAGLGDGAGGKTGPGCGNRNRLLGWGRTRRLRIFSEGRVGKVRGLTDLADFTTDKRSEPVEVFETGVLVRPGSDLLLDEVETVFEGLEFLLAGGEDLFLEGFQFQGAEGADLVVVLAIPLDECARGDLESTGDAFDAPALAAEFDEPGSSFGVVHNLFYEQSTKPTWTNAVQV